MTEALTLDIPKGNFQISLEFLDLATQQETLTGKSFDCNVLFATNFCEKYDEDTLVSLYETANYLGLDDLYKCLNVFIGSLYQDLTNKDIDRIYDTRNLPKSQYSNDP